MTVTHDEPDADSVRTGVEVDVLESDREDVSVGELDKLDDREVRALRV